MKSERNPHPNPSQTDGPKQGVADAGSAIDGALYGIPYADAAASLDPNVVAAIARLRDVDPKSLGELESALTTKAGDFAEPHLMHSVEGVTAEIISADTLGGTLATATNNEDWDFSVGDRLFQVKEGTSAPSAGLAAAEAHPDITVVTDTVASADLHTHAVDAVGLASLAPDHIHELVGETLDGVDFLSDIAIPIPVASAVLATIREVRRVNANEIQTDEAIANIAVHVGSRATAMALVIWVAGAATAIPTAGAGPIVLAILGSLASGRIAKGIVGAGIPRSMMTAIKEPYRKRAIEEQDIVRICESARSAAIAYNAGDEAAAVAELAFREAQERGDLFSANDRGRLLAKVMRPIIQRHYEEQLRKEAAEGQTRVDAMLASLDAKIRAPQRT